MIEADNRPVPDRAADALNGLASALIDLVEHADKLVRIDPFVDAPWKREIQRVISLASQIDTARAEAVQKYNGWKL